MAHCLISRAVHEVRAQDSSGREVARARQGDHSMAESVRSLFASVPTRRYRGGCQCGSVVYEVSLDFAGACAAAPSVWERVVRPGTFKLLRGEDSLRGLEFSASGVHHFFCEGCGTRAFSHVDSPDCGEFHTVDLKCLHVAGELPFAPLSRSAAS
jgi:hypothetical protein